MGNKDELSASKHRKKKQTKKDDGDDTDNVKSRGRKVTRKNSEDSTASNSRGRSSSKGRPTGTSRSTSKGPGKGGRSASKGPKKKKKREPREDETEDTESTTSSSTDAREDQPAPAKTAKKSNKTGNSTADTKKKKVSGNAKSKKTAPRDNDDEDHSDVQPEDIDLPNDYRATSVRLFRVEGILPTKKEKPVGVSDRARFKALLEEDEEEEDERTQHTKEETKPRKKSAWELREELKKTAAPAPRKKSAFELREELKKTGVPASKIGKKWTPPKTERPNKKGDEEEAPVKKVYKKWTPPKKEEAKKTAAGASTSIRRKSTSTSEDKTKILPSKSKQETAASKKVVPRKDIKTNLVSRQAANFFNDDRSTVPALPSMFTAHLDFAPAKKQVRHKNTLKKRADGSYYLVPKGEREAQAKGRQGAVKDSLSKYLEEEFDADFKI